MLSATIYRLRSNAIVCIAQFYHSFHTSPRIGKLSFESPKSKFPKDEFTSNSNPKSYNPSNITVLETLSYYRNDWRSALEFFNWVHSECGFEHTTDTYNQIIDVLGKYFEFSTISDLIKHMAKNPLCYPNHTTFRIAFKRYISTHCVQDALNLYNRLDEFNLKDETSFCNLIDALCDHKHVIEAEELCFGKNRMMGNANYGTKIYNMILRGWFRMGWWSKCREFWEEMSRNGIRRDLHSYTIYMDIMCKSGKPWKVVKLCKEMKKEGIQLDVVAYNTVLNAVGHSEGVDFAMRVYREMVEFGCAPNVVTYNTLLKLLCQGRRVKEAYTLLDQMSKKGCAPNVITYHCFFGCLVKPKEILRLFERMIGSSVRPQMDTYVMLMRKFGRWGFLRPVFVVWRKMEELGCSPDEFAYNALIDALVDKGMIDLARKYDEEMLAKGLSAKRRVELETKS